MLKAGTLKLRRGLRLTQHSQGTGRFLYQGSKIRNKLANEHKQYRNKYGSKFYREILKK